MSYLFFLDESGHDHRESPYEVRAAVAVHDARLWDLICALKQAELDHFGSEYCVEGREFKAKSLLKRKTFRLASQLGPLGSDERRAHACTALLHGDRADRMGITALAQAKLAYVRRALELCDEHQVAYFAAIVHPDSPRSLGDGLRKDYAYLFQRMYCFMEQCPDLERGLLVMDEMDRGEADSS